MIDSLINKDIELLIYLNNLGTVQWDGLWLFLSNKYSAIPLYLILLYFTYKQYGLKKTAVVVLFVVLLITISLLRGFIKISKKMTLKANS